MVNPVIIIFHSDNFLISIDLLLEKIYKLNIVNHYIFVCPILLGKNIGDTDIEFDYHSYELSLSLYDVYKRLCDRYRVDYLIDAKEFINPTFDNAHFDINGHKLLAEESFKIID